MPSKYLCHRRASQQVGVGVRPLYCSSLHGCPSVAAPHMRRPACTSRSAERARRTASAPLLQCPPAPSDASNLCCSAHDRVRRRLRARASESWPRTLHWQHSEYTPRDTFFYSGDRVRDYPLRSDHRRKGRRAKIRNEVNLLRSNTLNFHAIHKIGRSDTPLHAQAK